MPRPEVQLPARGGRATWGVDSSPAKGARAAGESGKVAVDME